MSTKKNYTLLCLGDSYTIGEGVPLHESFPYQLVQMLRKKKYHFHAPEIIAKTGWTAYELAEHIIETTFNEPYYFATLLIGVNNQYRGLQPNDYKKDFEFILKKLIDFVGGNARHVIVLSIPDWGATPFAKERNILQIEKEINVFNEINKSIANLYNCKYIDITGESTKAKDDISLLTNDMLHYAAKEHAVWAKEVLEIIVKLIGDYSPEIL